MKKLISQFVGSVIAVITTIIVYLFLSYNSEHNKTLRDIDRGRKDLRKTMGLYYAAVVIQNINNTDYMVRLKYDSLTNTITLKQYYAIRNTR